MSSDQQLTKEQILEAATIVLKVNGFAVSNSESVVGIDPANHRIFEDAYCIGMLAYFEDWQSLKDSWLEIQTSLIEKVSTVLSQADRKSWEVYLVLFSPGHVPIAEAASAKAIRYDTSRVRKLLSLGENLRELADIETALLPLLPLQDTGQLVQGPDVLRRLPEIVGASGAKARMIEIAVEAFESGESIASALHKEKSEA